MKTEEIDDIIANALAESKGKSAKDGSKWHRPKHNGDIIVKIRRILNYVFILGFVVTIILYFMFPDNKALFFSVGFGSLALKIVEFLLRFLF